MWIYDCRPLFNKKQLPSWDTIKLDLQLDRTIHHSTTRNFRNRVLIVKSNFTNQIANKNEILSNNRISTYFYPMRGKKARFFRKQPEADKVKSKFNEENEEKLPWHDVSIIMLLYKLQIFNCEHRKITKKTRRRR